MKNKPQSSRRKAKTVRGGEVMAQIANTARRLLCERWLDDISISELAREAGVVRASLLLQFPGGWPDIANCVAVREFDDDLLNKYHDLAENQGSRAVNERLYEALEMIIARAEETGLLYPNLRGQMFVWGDENALVMRCGLVDLWGEIEEMLHDTGPDRSEDACADLSMVLFDTALSLAAMSDIYLTFNERRAALRTTIDRLVAGVKAE